MSPAAGWKLETNPTLLIPLWVFRVDRSCPGLFIRLLDISCVQWSFAVNCVLCFSFMCFYKINVKSVYIDHLDWQVGTRTIDSKDQFWKNMSTTENGISSGLPRERINTTSHWNGKSYFHWLIKFVKIFKYPNNMLLFYWYFQMHCEHPTQEITNEPWPTGASNEHFEVPTHQQKW